MNYKIATYPDFKLAGISYDGDPEASSSWIEGKIKDHYLNAPIVEAPNQHELFCLRSYDQEQLKTIMMGCKVDEGSKPEATSLALDSHTYMIFKAGPLPLAKLRKSSWDFINDCFQHQTKFTRLYAHDFEVYDCKDFNPERLKVKIYVSVK